MRISDWSSDVCSSDLQHAGRYIPSPRRTVPRQIPPRPARAEPEGPGQSSDAGRRDRIPQAETGGGGVAGPYGSAAPGHHRRTGPEEHARYVVTTLEARRVATDDVRTCIDRGWLSDNKK